jgi:3D (Asp-Asp-Asp) domain-containing protein
VEYGLEEVMEAGVEGIKTYTYLLTYWIDEEIDKKLIDTKVDPPKEEVISKGTKIIWRMYSTSDVGRVKYWYKIRVWATKYDANCIGCTGRTYSGTEVKKGVCATDPRVIPLGTNFYVDGYGLCRAEDIGGAIKGNKIDLGYKDVTKGGWRTGYTDIFLLTNPPY